MIKLALDEWERELLRRLPRQLVTMLGEAPDDPALKRLFPPAYAAEDDDRFEAEYRRLMGADLQDRHRAALETLMATVDEVELDESQAEAWLIALNELRLVLGTKLDVGEDDDGPEPDDPRAVDYEVYAYLSSLQDALVRQLSR